MKTYKSLDEISDAAKALPDGQSLVGIVDVKKGAYLFIGDNLTSNWWAVTEEELKQLQVVLNRRYNENPHAQRMAENKR